MLPTEFRQCSKCAQVFPAAHFYKRQAQCKACICARVRQHRAENIEAVRAYDRERATLPHRIENATRVSREWRRRYRDRMRAHNMAHNDAALAARKPERCEGCGQSDVRIEKHHPDYSKPLLVVWFCKPCHVIADKIRRRLEAS